MTQSKERTEHKKRHGQNTLENKDDDNEWRCIIIQRMDVERDLDDKIWWRHSRWTSKRILIIPWTRRKKNRDKDPDGWETISSSLGKRRQQDDRRFDDFNGSDDDDRSLPRQREDRHRRSESSDGGGRKLFKNAMSRKS